MRPTIRLKLTLAYTFLFLLMGAALIGGIYYLTAQSTSESSDPRAQVERELSLPPGTLLRDVPRRGLGVLPPIDPPQTLRRVALGVQTETRSDLLDRLVLFSGALLLVMALASIGLGWLLARRILRPLRRITEQARTLSEASLHERLALRGPRDELRELADTFDQMLARLDAAFTGQRLFAANASHELRTPLTRIRTKLDVTLASPELSRQDLEEMAATIRDSVDRSSQLIESLLTLSRAEGDLGWEVVRLDHICRELIDEVSANAKTRRISMTHGVSSATIQGDRVLLEHLVMNLLVNAVQHNIDEGWVRVEVGTDGAFAFIHVSNSGPVVPPSDVDQLFLPLRRGDMDRPRASDGGSGLGLAIAKAVAEAHRGWILARALPEGGLLIDATFPAFGGTSGRACRVGWRAIESAGPRSEAGPARAIHGPG